jgi:protoporphyrin/coproporphyrin ferrochelatase
MPLYPQYSAATTASVCDRAFETLRGMRWQPTIRVLPPYYDEEVYIQALVGSLAREIGRLSFKPDVILASFHGVPEAYLHKGDPYHCHCAKTARLMRERLGLDEQQFMMSFQSRFGSAEWLKPYTDATVKALAAGGVKNLAVVMPGFVADCLETLEEIAVENAAIFRQHGGENFAAIPCLNDSEDGLTVIRQLAMRELAGWIEQS